ncbi:MAG TPA: permease, partial [Actinomycetota bacterium]
MRVGIEHRADATTVPAARRRPPVVAVLVCLIALGVAVRQADPSSVPWLRNLVIVFGSLLVEATPFILLGAAVSAAIEVFVPSSAFARIALLPRALQLPAAAAAGVAFPVCECGSVPVARRLASKGLAPSAAITFMLAAPVVNPVVVASTFIAYRGRDTLWVMVLGRLALGFVVAMTVGWVMGRIGSGELLRARSTDPAAPEEGNDAPRARRFFDHLAGDTMFMARFLIVGAALAASIQTFVPRSVVDGV